ncbi:unnamed protein product, partial [Ectocarpus sp. 12 AP-2014]
DKTCAALERDVHALAMLVFVEWREFVSALPGCGAVLSKETSALWFAQLRQRWACQATLHTSLATQPLSLDPAAATSAAEPGTRPPSPALDGSGRASKLPTSEPGSPRLSRLEPEIATDHFGAAVRMACADASAPYKLPLRDQHMFPDGDVGLPVCLVQRYEYAPKEEEGGGGGRRGRKAVREIRQGSGGDGGLAVATVDKEKLIDEDRSRSQSPVKPTAAAAAAAAVERFGGLGRRGRSRSSSPPGMQMMAAAAATGGGGGGDSGAGGGRRREKPFRSLSPLLTKGKVFFSPGGKARWPSSKSPARNHRRSPAAAGEGADDAVGNAAAAAAAGSSSHDGDRSEKDEDGAGGAGDGSSGGSSSPGGSNDVSGAESAGEGAEETNGRDTEIPAPGVAPEAAFTDSRHAKTAVLPPPPPPPPTPYSTPPPPSSSSRRGGEGPKPRGPSTPVKGGVLQASSPLRKTPVASPARPPLKPMAAEQQQKQRELRREESSSSAVGGGTGGNGRRPGGRPSLLDGVEQSSDLGAFFRQGEAGGRRRRGRRLSPGRRGTGSLAPGVLRRSPPRRTRAFAGGGGEKDQDEDEEEEEEEEEDEEEEEEGEEHGCGAGVGVHVIVLHHGYCGSSMDMRLIKNYIRILAPDALVLNAESNERDPHASMKMMGEKLAKEVHRFLLVRARSLLLPGGQGRLSFIGHSAGAVIIRVALTSPSLQPALGRLHMFVSLGSPHLGTVYGASGIVRTGMWAMKRWMKSALLEELGLTDAPRPRDTLLCWLSQQPGLEYFRHVVLVSADKDGYVPSQSARIQMCDASLRDAKREVPQGQASRSKVVCEMARALLEPINDNSLYRLHLWGGERQPNAGGGGMDEYIGRTAHV